MKANGIDLHAGDIFGVVTPPSQRSWIQRRIIAYQKSREGLPFPCSDISHVAMYCGAGRCFEAHPPRNGPLTLDDYKGKTIYVFRHHFERPETRLRIIQDLIFASNSKYNAYGVARFYLTWLPGNAAAHAKFCSQLIDEAYAKWGLQLLEGLPEDKSTPGHLCMSPIIPYIGKFTVDQIEYPEGWLAA